MSCQRGSSPPHERVRKIESSGEDGTLKEADKAENERGCQKDVFFVVV